MCTRPVCADQADMLHAHRIGCPARAATVWREPSDKLRASCKPCRCHQSHQHSWLGFNQASLIDAQGTSTSKPSQTQHLKYFRVTFDAAAIASSAIAAWSGCAFASRIGLLLCCTKCTPARKVRLLLIGPRIPQTHRDPLLGLHTAASQSQLRSLSRMNQSAVSICMRTCCCRSWIPEWRRLGESCSRLLQY